MKTIEEIRKAFLAMHHYATKENAPTYMSVPADRERDADLILSDAIDELERLRAEVIAAKADAARLREALEKRHEHDFVGGPCDQLGHHKCDCWASATAALSATDSGDWLAQHDAEVARRVRDEVVRLFRVAYDGPCVRGERIVASRTVDQLLRGAE